MKLFVLDVTCGSQLRCSFSPGASLSNRACVQLPLFRGVRNCCDSLLLIESLP
uniref:Uncharacterized protein n=1 Tax=Lotus japonicus TaxID=34305 RepID=I3S252_LOTJA|nr:unknown [Lotus japonicus]